MKNFIIGLLIAAGGSLMVIYTDALLSFSGRIDMAEDWLRMFGGSRLAYKLIGIIAIIVGFLMATGQLGPVVIWLFGGLFTGFQPAPAGS
jgi:hypothetical protein